MTNLFASQGHAHFRRVSSVFLALAAITSAQTPGTHGSSSTFHLPPHERGYLGAGIVEVTPDRARALRLAEATGVEVKYVEAGSAAAKAGLLTDDVILELNGQKVEGNDQFSLTIGNSAPGTKMAMTVWRAGSKRTLTAILGTRSVTLFAYSTDPDGTVTPFPPPFDAMPPMPTPGIGIDGESLTPQLAEFFGVKEGVLVRTVTAKSPADKAGLKAGDVITKVAGTPVTSPREITGLVRAGHQVAKAVAFTVVRNHREIVLNLELALEFDPWRDQGSSDGPYLACWLVR